MKNGKTIDAIVEAIDKENCHTCYKAIEHHMQDYSCCEPVINMEDWHIYCGGYKGKDEHERDAWIDHCDSIAHAEREAAL